MKTKAEIAGIESTVEELLTRLCHGVIAHPEDFEIIKPYSGQSLTKYHLRAHAADAPRIMGKGGERFKGLKTILQIIGDVNGRQINLETLQDPIKGKHEPFPAFKYDPRWPKADIQELMDDVCAALFNTAVDVEVHESIGSAILKVVVPPSVPATLIDTVSPVLESIFRGIGVTNGCQLSVDMWRMENEEIIEDTKFNR